MKWVIRLVIVVSALVALVILTGALLPRTHVAARTVTLRQPPESLWLAFTDYAAMPRWRPGVTAVEELPPRSGRHVWREHVGGDVITFETSDAEAPHHLVETIADSGLGYGGSWTVDIAPVAGGSRVTITENGTIDNPAFRFVARYVFGLTTTLDNTLEALGRRFGETVRPEAA